MKLGWITNEANNKKTKHNNVMLRKVNYMPSTITGIRTLTDSREQARTEAAIDLKSALHSLMKSTSKAHWQLTDKIHYHKCNGLDIPFIKDILREEYCKMEGIEADGRSKNGSYNSFATTIARLCIVANVPPDLYTKQKASGKSPLAIWAVRLGDGGKVARKLNGEAKHKDSKESLLAEAEAGVVNADVIVANYHEPSSSKSSPEREAEKAKSWSAPMKDTNKVWKKDSRYNAKNDARLFNQMLHSLIEYPIDMDKTIIDKMIEVVKFYKGRAR